MPREKSNKQLSKEITDKLKELRDKAKAIVAKINDSAPPREA